MTVRILKGDCLEVLRGLPDQSIACCVSSPPYWRQRDYGMAGQLGLEATPEEYIEKLTTIFREVRRVLKDDGTAWVNLGDKWASGGNGGGGSFMEARGEAASVAWEPLGWTPFGFSEIEAFPSALLAHHYGSNLPDELGRRIEHVTSLSSR